MNALLLTAVLAATPIRLEEVRNRSRENTQALTSFLEARIAEEEVKLTRAGLLPQVQLEVGATVGYIGPQLAYDIVRDPETGTFVRRPVETQASPYVDFSFSVGASQILYDRARWARLAQSGAQLEAERGEAQEQADTSELEGIRRFFTLYRGQAALGVLKETVTRSEQQLERARAMFRAGRVDRGEELAAQVNLGNDRVSVIQQQAQVAAAQAQLAVWLSLPGAEPLEAVDPGVLQKALAAPPTLEAALTEARARRPLVVALRQRVRAAEFAQNAARAGYLPRVGLLGSYSRGGPDAVAVFAQPRLQNRVTGGVTLQWDLFSGFSTAAEVRRAEYSQHITELNLSQIERELDSEVRRNHELLVAELAATALAEENRQAAIESLRLAEQRFSAGAGSTLEVRDAQLKLTRAELTVLEKRVDAETARFGLMRAMGTLGAGESQ